MGVSKMQRVGVVSRHVVSDCHAMPTFAMAGADKADDDVVICTAVRTAIAKGKKGGFKDTPTEDMLAPLFREVIRRTNVDPKSVGDVQIGNVGLPGAGALTGRMAQLLGGVPYDVPFSVVNRQCSSGLQAVANIAASIKAGVMDIGIAGGVESMTQTGMNVLPEMKTLNPHLAEAIQSGKADSELMELACGCMAPAGITSENVAERWKISRERQDQLA